MTADGPPSSAARASARSFWPRLLTWLLPGFFTLLTAVLVVRALEEQGSGPLVEGEVIRVEEYIYRPVGTDRAVTLYRPYFRYSLADGTTLEGQPDQAMPWWNYPIGEIVQIRHDPARRGVVTIPDGNKWYPAFAMGLVTVVMSGLAYLFARRSRRRVRQN